MRFKLTIYIKLLFIVLLVIINTSYANSVKTINIKSEQLTMDDKQGTAIYLGNVIANEGNQYLYAEQVTIYRDSDGKIKSIIAIAQPSTFNHEETNGEANIIEYFPKLEKMVLINNAKIFNNNKCITGNKLNYYLKQKTLTSNNKNTIIITPNIKSY